MTASRVCRVGGSVVGAALFAGCGCGGDPEPHTLGTNAATPPDALGEPCSTDEDCGAGLCCLQYPDYAEYPANTCVIPCEEFDLCEQAFYCPFCVEYASPPHCEEAYCS